MRFTSPKASPALLSAVLLLLHDGVIRILNGGQAYDGGIRLFPGEAKASIGFAFQGFEASHEQIDTFSP